MILMHFFFKTYFSSIRVVYRGHKLSFKTMSTSSKFANTQCIVKAKEDTCFKDDVFGMLIV